MAKLPGKMSSLFCMRKEIILCNFTKFDFPRFPLERNEVERRAEIRAGNRIWVEWKLATSEHLLLQRRLKHRLLSRMTARYTSLCERSGQLERNRKVAVIFFLLRSGRNKEGVARRRVMTQGALFFEPYVDVKFDRAGKFIPFH